MITRSIHNAGARPWIRRRFRIGVVYSTPPTKVEEALSIIADILNDHEGMPEGEEPKAEFESFGDYALQLLIEYRFEPPDFWQALSFDTRVN